MTTNTKNALNASHTGTFIIGCDNLVLLLLSVPTTRFENTSFATIFAPKLLAATGVVSVLDNVGTAASSAHMYDLFYYHVVTISSLHLDHYHIILVELFVSLLSPYHFSQCTTSSKVFRPPFCGVAVSTFSSAGYPNESARRKCHSGGNPNTSRAFSGS